MNNEEFQKMANYNLDNVKKIQKKFNIKPVNNHNELSKDAEMIQYCDQENAYLDNKRQSSIEKTMINFNKFLITDHE